MTWTTITDGRSRTVKASAVDRVLNDATDAWCVSATAYGDGSNRGSPRALDPNCP